jgi:radical SAM protein with 4Fe4S-binding SPASM domain
MALKLPENLRLTSYELVITENCNSQCSYCFDNYFAGKRVNTDDPVRRMDMSIMPDIIKFIEATNSTLIDSKLAIHYIGGEPLMNFKFMEESVQKFRQHFGPIATFSANTNITIISEAILDFFVKYKFDLTTSIDGGRDSHNAHRGNWDKVIRNLIRVKTRFIDAFGPNSSNIGAVFVVSADRAEHLVEDYRTLSHFCDCRINLNAEDPGWTEEKVNKACEAVKILADTDPRFVEFSDAFTIYRSKYHDVKGGRNIPYFCNPPERNVTINPQGKLFFCHRLTPKSYEFTPEFSEFYGDIWSGYTNTEYWNKMKEIRVGGSQMFEECKTCGYVDLCKQGCRAVVFSNNNKVNPIMCQYTKTYLDILKQRYE